ncbi:MAG: hypothetical protein N3G21_03930 [Candidatus Hydrogenedentes bacterium]|nr:hypothetical protein [Candidatus Hydrogenedentota bacterium]
MNHRERVVSALNFCEVDRIPMDLGGMDSTGISAFAYKRLVEHIGFGKRSPYVHDTCQMLALPELDVIDYLGCDVVTVRMGYTNAFIDDSEWSEFDFGGRLQAKVRNPSIFEVLPDGTVIQRANKMKMPRDSYVFDAEHGGHPIYFEGEIPDIDLEKIKEELEKNRLTDEVILKTEKICAEIYYNTDYAIFFNGPTLGIGIGNYGGLAYFPLLCICDEEKVSKLHDLILEFSLSEVERVLPKISKYITVYMCNSDDWGTQKGLIASPEIFKKLFLPYYREFNDFIHGCGGNIKTFFHSCGAIYELLDLIVDAGFDIINPVQWTAGGRSYKDWKDKCRGRLIMWGGGVDSQHTLVSGDLKVLAKEVQEIVSILGEDSGYIFCSIHNILAEVQPESIIEMYRTARKVNL